ncbi:MAG: alpha/beta hydrolase [Brachybacterium sp.]|nr:alpha/beta hydrolase [Brachybacterium sp.]
MTHQSDVSTPTQAARGSSRPPGADVVDASPAKRLGRMFRFVGSLPDAAMDLVLRRTHKPSKPPKKTVRRDLVARTWSRGIPITWVEGGRSQTSTIVHLHGGAYVFGEAPQHWRWLEEVRRRSGSAAAMVHYRMPPDHPFPYALDDALAAIRGLQDEGIVRPEQWVLSGDSAGGGLALAVAQALRDNDEPLPAGLLLTSPWADLATDSADVYRLEDSDVVLDAQTLRRFADLYRGTYAVEDPRLSPLEGEMAGLPPVHLVAGDAEILVGDARRLREKLRDAGVPIAYIEQPGGPHAYPLFGNDPASQWAIRQQIAFIRAATGLETS